MPTLAEARVYLDQLDLTYIAESMCAPSYPLPRWTLKEALHCLQLYKNFLYLQKKHLPYFLVPTREIDEFWHNHILYTKNYHQDCEAIFGHYLHHEPANPKENTDTLIKEYLQTKRWYEEEFHRSL